MNLWTWLLTEVSPSPLPDTSKIVEAPSWIGFVATAFVAIASVLLILDMNRRIRRSRYREDIREKLEAEEAKQSKSASLAKSAKSASGAQSAAKKPNSAKKPNPKSKPKS